MSQAFLSFLSQERLEYSRVSFSREVPSFRCAAAVLDITYGQEEEREQKTKKKSRLSMLSTHSICSVQTRFTRTVVRAAACSTQTVQGDIPLIQQFKVRRGLILLHFLLAIFPQLYIIQLQL